jgi:hypothetical protein
MFRLVSVIGIACFAVAAVALFAPATSPSAECLPRDEDLAETRNRLPVPVNAALAACPAFHARFSVN